MRLLELIILVQIRTASTMNFADMMDFTASEGSFASNSEAAMVFPEKGLNGNNRILQFSFDYSFSDSIYQPSGQPSLRETSDYPSRTSFCPTTVPSSRPTADVSLKPSCQPSIPSGTPTTTPTSEPSRSATLLPSPRPSSHPSWTLPSSVPSSSFPSAALSTEPFTPSSGQPSGIPSGVPSGAPSMVPSGQPSGLSSSVLSTAPSVSSGSNGSSTANVSMTPTNLPSSEPSKRPSSAPSGVSSNVPSSASSNRPSAHSSKPSSSPSVIPLSFPSAAPSYWDPDATRIPTSLPSVASTDQPSNLPSVTPTQAPTISPQFLMLSAYGGSRADYLNSMVVPQDWGTLLAGYYIGDSASEYDGVVVKLDACGNVVWGRTYGGPSIDSIAKIALLRDGTAVFVGEWANANSINILLGHIDITTGAMIKSFSFTSLRTANRGTDVVLTSDGNAIMIGSASSSSGTSAFIVKTTLENGVVPWAYILPGNVLGVLYTYSALVQINSGAFVVVGYGDLQGAYSAVISRFSAIGDHISSEKFGTSGFEQALSVDRCRDGGYVVAAVSRVVSSENSILVIKYNFRDEVQWAKEIDGGKADSPRRVISTHDGGYMVVGSTTSIGVGTAKGCFIKLDKSGNMEWSRAFGKLTYTRDYISDAVELPGGGYRLGGNGNSYRASASSDAFVLQIGADGNIKNHESVHDMFGTFNVQNVSIVSTSISSSIRYMDIDSADVTTSVSVSLNPWDRDTFMSTTCDTSGFQHSSWPSKEPTSSPMSSHPTYQPSTQEPLSSIPSGAPISSVPTSSSPTSPMPSHLPSTTAPTSSKPTASPTAPTLKPTPRPSIIPGNPTPGPTLEPSFEPTGAPSGQPTAQPTFHPSGQPSEVPTTSYPTWSNPTSFPTTSMPSESPSDGPTQRPIRIPTTSPTVRPSSCPTFHPSAAPSHIPSTFSPTTEPTASIEVKERSSDDSTFTNSAGLGIVIVTGVLCLVVIARIIFLHYTNEEFTIMEFCSMAFWPHPNKTVDSVEYMCVDRETGEARPVYFVPVVPPGKQKQKIHPNDALVLVEEGSSLVLEDDHLMAPEATFASSKGTIAASESNICLHEEERVQRMRNASSGADGNLSAANAGNAIEENGESDDSDDEVCRAFMGNSGFVNMDKPPPMSPSQSEPPVKHEKERTRGEMEYAENVSVKQTNDRGLAIVLEESSQPSSGEDKCISESKSDDEEDSLDGFIDADEALYILNTTWSQRDDAIVDGKDSDESYIVDASEKFWSSSDSDDDDDDLRAFMDTKGIVNIVSDIDMDDFSDSSSTDEQNNY